MGVTSPNESVLANQKYDFLEGYCTGESTFYVPVTNWGNETTLLKKDSMIGHIELATLMDSEDATWDDEQLTITVRICSDEAHRERGKKLEVKLNIGRVVHQRRGKH